MTNEEIKLFLSEPNNIIIATNRKSNAPQLSPVWYLWDGQAFYFSTTKDRVKYKNILKDPYISAIVDDASSHKYVVASGKAEIIDHDFSECTREIIKKYVSEDKVKDWEGVFNAPERVIIKLIPEKLLTN